MEPLMERVPLPGQLLKGPLERVTEASYDSPELDSASSKIRVRWNAPGHNKESSEEFLVTGCLERLQNEVSGRIGLPTSDFHLRDQNGRSLFTVPPSTTRKLDPGISRPIDVDAMRDWRSGSERGAEPPEARADRARAPP